MKTILHYFSILLVVLSTANEACAQTVIDYSAWTPNNNCNIFGTGPSINGLEHRTVIGTPIYDVQSQTVSLLSDKSNNLTRGTSYRINYNFKKGYTYKITVKAFRIKGEPLSSDIELRSELINSSTTTTQCAGPEFNNNYGGAHPRLKLIILT